MGLLKEKKKTKRLGARLASGGASVSQISPLRPRYLERLPPCTASCPSGNDIRGWLTAISLREKLARASSACEAPGCFRDNPSRR
jgi:hypothetical protein